MEARKYQTLLKYCSVVSRSRYFLQEVEMFKYIYSSALEVLQKCLAHVMYLYLTRVFILIA